MLNKPSTCDSCSVAKKYQGFCPDKIVSGARLAVWADSPGISEITRVPPEPLTGQSGFVLENWILPRAGLQGVPYHKCNTIRCHPSGDKYPIGKVRRAAETLCRQYDQVKPADFDATLITLHPASVMRSKFDPLPLIIRDFQRAKALLDDGQTVMVLMGTEAMDLWAPDLRHPEKGVNYSVSDWRGHYWGTKTRAPGVESWENQPHPDRLRAMFNNASAVSVDLEWNPETQVLQRVGLWGDKGGATFAWDDVVYANALRQILLNTGEIIFHNGLGSKSDYHVLSQHGLCPSYAKVRDTMLAMHLLWPQFAGLGFLDLWTCTSMVSDVPNWKLCRGRDCVGACPKHQPAWYNVTDAWAAYRIWAEIRPELTIRGMA